MDNTSILTPNFLLENELSQHLFHQTAASLPIIDYHNHIVPAHIAVNKQFKNIADLWLNSDPYKHRAMRINGVPEKYITGPSTDNEKFKCWSETLPQLLGNPLYHWSMLELKRVFGIEVLLNAETTDQVWNQCNEKLADQTYATVPIMDRWNIDTLCTSDSWLDDLSVHAAATKKAQADILPSLRADAVLDFEGSGYHDFLKDLASMTGHEIHHLEDLKSALVDRLDYFKNHNCRLSDHALDAGFRFELPDSSKADSLFGQVVEGKSLSTREHIQLQSYLLVFLGIEYSKRGWILQLHIGAQRSTSSRLKAAVGKAGGYATIGSATGIEQLTSYLDSLEQAGDLPDIILYNLNPVDNQAFATLTGSFTEDGTPGKVQFGPAWWYNDHIQGIQEHLTAVSNYSLLGVFIGMTTDSRSILSFSRHEYFRRILCNMIGTWAEKGMVPADEKMLSELVANISYYNAKSKLKTNG